MKNRKSLIFIFLLIISFFECSKPSRTDLLDQEDIEYFKEAFENGYVFMMNCMKKRLLNLIQRGLLNSTKKI